MDIQHDHLVRWVKDGIAPPSAPQIEFTSGDQPVIARDEHGLALGGIRLPDIEVPIASNTGINGPGPCFLVGTNQPFDRTTLQQLYPNHRGYVQRVARSALENLLGRYILSEAAWTFVRDAEKADLLSL